MPVNKTRMGYETQLFYGTAGAQAAIQITNATDVEYNMDPERGDTTTRGDGTAVPIITSRVTGIKPTVTFTMLNKPEDTQLAAMIAVAKTGAPIAIRTKNYSGGLGYDGDMTFGKKDGAPLKGTGTFEFTGEATEEAGRLPQVWV